MVVFGRNWFSKYEKTLLELGACRSVLKKMREDVRRGRLTESMLIADLEKVLEYGDVEELVERYMPRGRVNSDVCIDAVYGAIFGDIVGSRYEGRRLHKENASLAVQAAFAEPKQYRLTDDSVLTLATALAIMSSHDISDVHTTNGRYFGCGVNDFSGMYLEFAQKYTDAGYGSAFCCWADGDGQNPYGSNGNGSAMRISPVGALGLSCRKTIRTAIASSVCTHNHIEGIRGACVEVVCINMASDRNKDKERIFNYMRDVYSLPGENLFSEFSLEEACKVYSHQVQCQFSVPASIIAFHESASFFDAIQKALLVGRDTDTNACICGAVAGAFYGVLPDVKKFVIGMCDDFQQSILKDFEVYLRRK